MSEILIPNVDLPKKEGDATYLRIDSYGHVFQYDHRTIEMRTIAKVVELPPHGRLIDADTLLKSLKEVSIPDEKIKGTFTKMMCDFATQIIEKSVTVIVASEERE